MTALFVPLPVDTVGEAIDYTFCWIGGAQDPPEMRAGYLLVT
jgi:hypothetical protein